MLQNNWFSLSSGIKSIFHWLQDYDMDNSSLPSQIVNKRKMILFFDITLENKTMNEKLFNVCWFIIDTFISLANLLTGQTVPKKTYTHMHTDFACI